MNNKFGNNLRFYRRQADLTLKEMSEKVGMSLGTYQKYETGQIKHIGIDLVNTFAKTLSISPAVLLGWEEDKETIKKKILAAEMELCGLDEVHNAELIKEKERELLELRKEYKNYIDSENYINSEETNKKIAENNEAVALYELYKKATPNVQAAIDALLKGIQQQP